MQREKIDIQLYKGYAVVKGEYWMYNESNDSISIKTGYPLNANYNTFKRASDLTEISFGEIYGLKVLINNQELAITQKAIDTHVPRVDSYETDSQWFVWDSRFLPKAITKVTVYFLVNTNESNVLQGYDSEDYNSFIYVLETAASWKLPIVKGQINIQLMEGMDLGQIRGGSPDSIFQYNSKQQLLSYSFENLYPNRESNIVVTYGKQQVNFDFAKIMNRKQELFQTLDQFSNQVFPAAVFKSIRLDSPFEISSIGSNTVGLLFYILIYGPILLGAIILFLLIRWLFLKFKKKPLKRKV